MPKLPGSCKVKTVNSTDSRKKNSLIAKIWCQLCLKPLSVSEASTRHRKQSHDSQEELL